MKEYTIITPEGITTIVANSFYHAIQLVVEKFGYKFSNCELINLNHSRK